ncbi:lacticin 481 family lantibiotic [Staphylococcus pettenkoferi]|uniref:lacticin 481 family lantibiotic n=1 Tax=Staphylococcus pettenkoferi TaxID=170573 RepID=UPI002272D492|nr:lacticin 481 family lantibiotic [Staphylococcus pettenkoferi]MCY1575899.1 lacticin 481 family lantibiotic [Staphylococcus pettenkoferi]MCY1617835.1 lacticin 481 family lantibiotic [Staphylococcus pettenkoferi]
MKNLESLKELNLLEEVSEEELDEVLGGKKGDGVFKTVSKECKMNTWQFIATCCS